MLLSAIPIFLLPFLATTQVLARIDRPNLKPTPRDLNAILVEPATSSPSPSPTPILQHLELRQAAAPAAGVGGAGAVPPAAQPPADAGANSITTQQITTVVGGVTKVINTIITETSDAGATAPAVQSGSIGLGTLTGQIGVVKTQNAKSDAVIIGPRWGMREVGMVVITGMAALGGGVLGLAIL